jgi:predicted P-loop ATPase
MSNKSNIESILNTKYDFRYNEINNKLEYKLKNSEHYSEIKEYDLNSILRLANASLTKKVLKKELAELLNSSFTPTYNPFLDYFISLPSWKPGEPDYIEMLASTISVSSSEVINWKKWFRKWLVGTVACALSQDKTNQQVLVLVGGQGIGKTTWLYKLCPLNLRPYYYGGNINLGNKDSEIQLSENLFINLDELENLNKKGISSLKEFITKPSIKLRRPYGSFAETMPRRASFMGSVNNMEFLHDQTGNRRFLCFYTESIDYTHSIDLDKVYAQSYYLFQQEFQYWFCGEDIQEISYHNDKYIVVSLEQEILEKNFEPCLPGETPDLELETEELVAHIYQLSTLSKRLSPKTIGSALTKMNWPKRKTGGRRKWLLNKKED